MNISTENQNTLQKVWGIKFAEKSPMVQRIYLSSLKIALSEALKEEDFGRIVEINGMMKVMLKRKIRPKLSAQEYKEIGVLFRKVSDINRILGFTGQAQLNIQNKYYTKALGFAANAKKVMDETQMELQGIKGIVHKTLGDVYNESSRGFRELKQAKEAAEFLQLAQQHYLQSLTCLSNTTHYEDFIRVSEAMIEIFNEILSIEKIPIISVPRF